MSSGADIEKSADSQGVCVSPDGPQHLKSPLYTGAFHTVSTYILKAEVGSAVKLTASGVNVCRLL